MKHAQPKSDKTATIGVTALVDAAVVAYADGNFAATSSLLQRVQRLDPGAAAHVRAQALLANLHCDPVAIYVGVASTALYALAWIYALAQR